MRIVQISAQQEHLLASGNTTDTMEEIPDARLQHRQLVLQGALQESGTGWRCPTCTMKSPPKTLLCVTSASCSDQLVEPTLPCRRSLARLARSFVNHSSGYDSPPSFTSSERERFANTNSDRSSFYMNLQQHGTLAFAT